MARRKLSTGSIPGHFRALAIPAAIGMVFTTLYNVVDVYYAGKLSTDAQAGLALSFQVFFLFIALGFGLSTAMGALVGNALGEESGEEGEIAAQGLAFAALVSALGILVAWFAAPLLIRLISEPGAYRDAAVQYLRLLIFAIPAFLVSYGANGILAAQGDTKSMQYANVAAFFANLALNPLFIFGLGPWEGIGFNGIALSTLLSQSGVMAFILWRVFRSDAMQGPRTFRPIPARFAEIAGQALPASFAMIVMMIAGFVVQYFLKGFGGAAVAAYGVSLRIEQLLLLPAFGLTNALLPIVSQNYGARNFDRVREAVRFCFAAGVALMLMASCILWFAAGPALRLFSADPELVEIGKGYLHVDGFILPVYVLLFSINSILQAFKRPGLTVWIGVYRQGIGVALFVWLCVRVFDLGVTGVWYGIATAVVTGLVLSLVIVERLARQKIGGLFTGPREPEGVPG
ncbi:MATE family efflux transporter [Oceaniglobus roseus]|uniref:MATE family efflux transporter n=1 Tax=Oceaniglobus roseus TaxID=1737570 RepID=UPI000C7F2CD8|nr:MATE family efflux transporter [Kandeliimicrobium roseum]